MNLMATWDNIDSSESTGKEAHIFFMTNASSETLYGINDEEVDTFDLDCVRQSYYESITYNGKLVKMYKTLKRKGMALVMAQENWPHNLETTFKAKETRPCKRLSIFFIQSQSSV